MSLTHLVRARRALLTATFAAAALLTAAFSITPAHAATTTKPTIVLVHGAWADGSSWTVSSETSSAAATRLTFRPTRFEACTTTRPI